MRRARPRPAPPAAPPQPRQHRVHAITMPTDPPINPKAVSTGALRVGGVPFRILPDAAEGQVLVYRGGAWVPTALPAATPAPPSSPAWAPEARDWDGPPEDLAAAVDRLARQLATIAGPVP